MIQQQFPEQAELQRQQREMEQTPPPSPIVCRIASTYRTACPKSFRINTNPSLQPTFVIREQQPLAEPECKPSVTPSPTKTRLPHSAGAEVPIQLSIERKYRETTTEASSSTLGFNHLFAKALRQLEKKASRMAIISKGHVLKGVNELSVQRCDDWVSAVDELLPQCGLLKQEELTEAQQYRLVTVLARTCLALDDNLVADHWRIKRKSVTTYAELKSTFAERFLGRDPLRPLWERWEACAQGQRRFDSCYWELIQLKDQLPEVSNSVMFRKLKTGTSTVIKRKYHDRASELHADDFECLAAIYQEADDAIRSHSRKETR